MIPRDDLFGQRFDRLQVLAAASTSSGHSRWLCLCDCGHTVTVRGDNLKRGISKSCGCLNTEKRRQRMSAANTTHGLTHTKTYSIWKSMHQRCSNPNRDHWKDYGDRGITVCERWSDFENFLADMGPALPGQSIERVDVNQGYFPENCIWIDIHKQNSNKRNSRLVEWNGQQKTMSEWAQILGIPKATLSYRLDKGWPLDKVFASQYVDQP